MSQPPVSVNSLAPLINVSLLLSATQRTINRSRHLPGIVGFYGYAGWGKTQAARFVTNSVDAAHIEIKKFWDKPMLFEELCGELGLRPKNRSVAHMGALIAGHLSVTQTPVIIDDFDIAVQRNWVDEIRGLYEASKAPFIIIGEDTLPGDLQRWERFHSRVREWVPAQPNDIEDCRTLVRLYGYPGVTIAEDLLANLHTQSGGSARRICNNIDKVNEFAAENALNMVDCALWGGNHFDTGEAPQRSGYVASKSRRRK